MTIVLTPCNVLCIGQSLKAQDLWKMSRLVFGVKNVAAPAVYRQAMTEAVKNLQFLGFKVPFLKPSRTTHPDKAMAKVYP
ncbi:MAG: hypothetical protein KME05_20205 [Gloeocapsa sp. UFS-A4-WI-NPMV-4B04]|nr:hypothetical protein [Gloeocapsa sp. UFS-A4-WI-NPMV-4B04]